MNMISTGTFLPEMDASDKQETVAEKFARVWEKKNAKAARAGGVSLMALSLAACGSDSSDTPVVDAGDDEETPVVVEPVVNRFDLTDDDAAGVGPDNFAGQNGENDIFTALAGTLDAADDIVDLDSTDADELNVTLAGQGPAADIDGIESINVNFDLINGGALGAARADVDAGTNAAQFNATNVTGATITVSSNTLGYNGYAEVVAPSTNTVVAGENVTTLAVVDATTGTIDAGAATTLSIDTVDTTAAAPNVTNNIVVNGNVALDVDFDNAGADTDDLTINITSTAASDVTLTTASNQAINAAGSILTISNDAGVSLVVDAANETEMVAGGAGGFAEVHIDGGRLELTDGTDFNLDDVDVTEVEITYGNGTNSVALTEVEGANILVSAEDANVTLTGDGLAHTASTVSVTVSDDQSGAGSLIDFDSGASSLTSSTLSILAADGANNTSEFLAVSFGNDLTLNLTDDLTIATLTPVGALNGASTAYTNDLVIAGTGDLTFTNAIADVVNINASQLVGGISSDDAAGFNTSGVVTSTVSIVGGQGDDNLLFAADTGTETVSVSTGTGDDTIDGTNLDTATMIADGGAGADTITIGAVTGTAVVDAGAGDDTIVLAGAAPTGAITIDGGAGDDTLDLAGIDTTGATFAISNVETIEMGGSVSLNGSDVSGATLTFTSDTAASVLTIVDDSTTGNGTIDTSNFTLSAAGGEVIDNLAITVAGVDTITLGANDEALTITGEAGAYTDVDASGNIDDGDTFFGEFTVITGYDQGTVAGGAITSAADTGHANISGGAGDEIALNGTWNATTSTFTVDDTNGTDCLVFSDTADLCAVFVGTTDLIV